MHGVASGTRTVDCSELHHLYPNVYPARLQSAVIRKRVESYTDQKSEFTVRDMVKTMRMLERWMWSKYGDDRQTETIPASELDAYLAEFYRVVRKESGEEYGPVSFRKLHYCIKRFLSESGYECCMMTSGKFMQSRTAYCKRLKKLNDLVKMKK